MRREPERRRRGPPCSFSLLVLLLLAAACGGSENRATTTAARAAATSTRAPTAPARDDPVGDVLAALTASSVPPDSSAADHVLKALPDAVEGIPLASRTTSEAVYGTGAGADGTITVTPLAQAAGPKAKMPDFFERFAGSSQIQVQRRQLASAPVLFLTGTSTEPPNRPSAAWARPDGDLLFAAEADTTELLAGLVGAAVQAGRG